MKPYGCIKIRGNIDFSNGMLLNGIKVLAEPEDNFSKNARELNPKWPMFRDQTYGNTAIFQPYQLPMCRDTGIILSNLSVNVV